ncbi:MAG: hypothetical protein ACOYNR_11860, partial [Blastocatellia bacterium]
IFNSLLCGVPSGHGKCPKYSTGLRPASSTKKEFDDFVGTNLGGMENGKWRMENGEWKIRRTD